MQTSDQECIERCRNGSPEEFRLLVERYQGPVFAFASSRLRNDAQARDATEEAFVRAYFSLGKLKKPESFHSWLLGIAGRVALEFQRRRSRQPEFAPVDQADTPAREAEPDSMPLDEAIAALPEMQRQMILLRYFEQLSCREIAAKLDVPIGTVTKTLSRAYEELRATLQARSASTNETLEDVK